MPPTTRREWIRQTAARLASAGVEAPQLVARLLLGHLLELSKEQVITRDHHPLTAAQAAELDEMVARRIGGEPLAYIVGSIEFYGCRFRVDRRVLIPRSETELLVDFALARAPGAAAWHLADIGTGSGCIPVAVARNNPYVRAIATDISDAALEVARENVWSNQVSDRIELRAGDLFAALPPAMTNTFDLIVSNPPYIDPAVRDSLRPEVQVQPASALFAGNAGEGGAQIHQRLVTGAPQWLRPGGWLAMEIGYDQAEVVQQMLRDDRRYIPVSIRLIHDLAGLPRVVAARVLD